MEIICYLLTVYLVAVFVRIVLSWFPIDPNGMIATVHGFLHLVTEPLMGPLRRVLPTVQLGTVALDLSPIVIIIGIQLLQGVLCG